MDIKDILERLSRGELEASQAELLIKKKPFTDLGYATIDDQRWIRNGVSEVIYAEGKSTEQIAGIIDRMKENGQNNILITRLSEEKALAVRDRKADKIKDFQYFADGRTAVIGDFAPADGIGKITVVTAGTSDIPVAKEAVITAKFLGNEVMEIYDVGVSGLHRLLARADDLMSSKVVITIAGMEGALASVIGGLVSCPVIAVPTSIGYGASFNGLAALLSMLNSCANGISVVNIDNGYGAAYQASLINHIR
ncbi:MAG: nickel pincer cofactor biosynthesis protein LarB [Lachnospiraceae bacterium]|nr:nickel pincer cofactor biosynthesis protein LarB [Lachnospiraceae bacterium]